MHSVGDNFVVNGSSDANKGKDFYIIMCMNVKERISTARSDNRGNILAARSVVVIGYYYERV